MVKENIPAWLGAPAILPVDALSVSPGGNEPTITDQLSGAVPPVALSCAV